MVLHTNLTLYKGDNNGASISKVAPSFGIQLTLASNWNTRRIVSLSPVGSGRLMIRTNHRLMFSLVRNLVGSITQSIASCEGCRHSISPSRLVYEPQRTGKTVSVARSQFAGPNSNSSILRCVPPEMTGLWSKNQQANCLAWRSPSNRARKGGSQVMRTSLESRNDSVNRSPL
jgi:hypothetical protein